MAEGTRSERMETPVDRIRQEVERVIDAVRVQGERALDAFGLREASKGWRPAVDVVETEANVEVSVDTPGVDPQSLEISLVGNMLAIAGRREILPQAPDAVRHRRECPSGAFSVNVPLPVAVDHERVSAESRFGVLMVRVGKKEVTRPTPIRVQVQTVQPVQTVPQSG